MLQFSPRTKASDENLQDSHKDRINRPSPDLLETLYLCQQRQEWYREFSRIIGETSLDFVGSLSTADDPVLAAEKICSLLQFSIENRRNTATWEEALRKFINQVDSAGIMVMVSGIVGGNTRRKLNPEEFRGFALSEKRAPLIFLNGADTKSGQMFTLAHERAGAYPAWRNRRFRCYS